MSAEGIRCWFYIISGALSLLLMWVGFFLGVYANELYKLIKPYLKRRNRG